MQTEHEVMAMATSFSFSCTQGVLSRALESSSSRADTLPEHSPPLASHTVSKSCRLHLAVLGPFQALYLHPTQSHSYLCLAPRWFLASWQLTLYTVARMTFQQLSFPLLKSVTVFPQLVVLLIHDSLMYGWPPTVL